MASKEDVGLCHNMYDTSELISILVGTTKTEEIQFSDRSGNWMG